MASFGPFLWGSSGTVAQHLFEHAGVSVSWLTAVRMTFTGIVLLLLAACLHDNIWSIFADRRSAARLLLFTVFGMTGVQLSYFMAISTGNAATATILQYLSPVMIILLLSLRNLRLPRKLDAISVIVAVAGTTLIVTQGRTDTLAVPPAGIIWGLLAAAGAVAYTLLPRELLLRYGALPVVGWSMLIGGLITQAVFRPWAQRVQLDVPGAIEVAFVVVFGTAMAYLLYLQSLKYIEATTASILGAIEPLTAAILGFIFMGTSANQYSVIGMVMVIAVTFIQFIAYRKSPPLHRGNERGKLSP
ncbi:EamA family transporter [Bifidobacterium sp.]|nr:DMT family transporter [Bifidobacterium sp.]MCI1224275.1 DMT family transporter [Bifidobacterium sp.]